MRPGKGSGTGKGGKTFATLTRGLRLLEEEFGCRLEKQVCGERTKYVLKNSDHRVFAYLRGSLHSNAVEACMIQFCNKTRDFRALGVIYE